MKTNVKELMKALDAACEKTKEKLPVDNESSKDAAVGNRGQSLQRENEQDDDDNKALNTTVNNYHQQAILQSAVQFWFSLLAAIAGFIVTHIICIIVFLIADKIFKRYITNKGYIIVNEMKIGNVFIPFSYYNFSVKYIMKNNKYGLILGKKNMIEPQYDEIRFYKKYNDMIAVKKDGRWGFIGITDTFKRVIYEAISPQYDLVADFGVISALVMLNGKQFYINKKGKRI